jgi:hypothetical protein
MSSYDIVIDSSTRKDRSTTDANNFTVYLSTPLYGIQSVNFASASIPYLNSASQVNGNVHAYYVVLEVHNYGILTDRIYTVDNPPESGDTNLNFAYTGSLIVPALAGASPTNYVMSSMNDRFSVQKTVPVMEAIKVSIYYYDTSDSSFKLYPFTSTGTATEEFVLKLSVQATKDKRFATKKQDDEDKRLEPNIGPPVTPGSENTFARKLINYYRSATRNRNNPEEITEPVGALLPRREFMGVPSKYAQILIPIAVVLLVLAILLAK